MPTTISTKLSEFLEPLANWFRSFHFPEAIVHWGHPIMMGIVVLVLGSYVVYAGWQGRISMDKDALLKGKADHRKLAPLMALFIFLGYTGGVLSLVMQRQPILQSPHFWTGSFVLILLTLQGTFSLAGFWGDKPNLRTIHAYVGTVTFLLLLIHGVLGLRLGLAI